MSGDWMIDPPRELEADDTRPASVGEAIETDYAMMLQRYARAWVSGPLADGPGTVAEWNAHLVGMYRRESALIVRCARSPAEIEEDLQMDIIAALDARWYGGQKQ